MLVSTQGSYYAPSSHLFQFPTSCVLPLDNPIGVSGTQQLAVQWCYPIAPTDKLRSIHAAQATKLSSQPRSRVPRCLVVLCDPQGHVFVEHRRFRELLMISRDDLTPSTLCTLLRS